MSQGDTSEQRDNSTLTPHGSTDVELRLAERLIEDVDMTLEEKQ